MIAYKAALGYSPFTYRYCLNNFDEYCCTDFPKETILTKELVEGWVRLSDTESTNSLRRRATAVRELGRYLHSIGLPAYIMPTGMIARQTRYVPHIYTEQELSAFFYGAYHYDDQVKDPLVQYIVPVLFRVMYCCGLRPSEGRLIKTEDINLETGRVYIREAKRHKDRIVVLSDDVLLLCRRYDCLRKTLCGESECFFPDKDGRARTARWAGYQFKKCWRISGMDNFTDPRPRMYDFRHSFATKKLHDWLDAGENLYSMLPYLSSYMGHCNFAITAYYVHLLPERLRQSPMIDWQAFGELLPEAPL